MAVLDERAVGLGGRAHPFVLVCIIMPIIGLLLLLNRVYHRFKAVMKLGADGCVIVFSWVSTSFFNLISEF